MNNIAPANVVATVASGQEVCQAENVPPEARRVVLAVEPGSGAPRRVAVRIEGGGRTARGHGAAPAGDRIVSAELKGTTAAGSRSLCLRNAGDGPLQVLGASPTSEPPAAVPGDRVEALGPFHVQYYRDGEETWWELGPTVADRFALGNAGFLGPWAFWFAVALALAAVAVAIAVLARREVDR